MRNIRALLFVIALGISFLSLGVSYANIIEIPASTTVIEEEAFCGISDVAFIFLPEGIQQIKSKAFAEVSVWDINLPSSLEFIDDNAFQNASIGEIRVTQGTYAHTWLNSKALSMGFPQPPIINVPDEIQAGEDFLLSITPVPGASFYDGDIDFTDGGEIVGSIGDNYSFGIHGYDTSPGIHTFAVTAFSPDYHRTVVQVPVIIVGERPPAREAIPNKDILCAKESIEITVDIHDAEDIHYELCLPGGSSHTPVIHDNGDTQVFEYVVDSIGWFSFKYTVKVDGKWSLWSDEILIKVINEDGTDVPEEIDAPVIHIPEYVEAGEDITISIEPVNGAVGYYGWFGNDEEHEMRLNSYNNYYTDTLYGYEVEPGECSVSATSISINGQHMTSGETFIIHGEKAPAPLVEASNTDVVIGENYSISVNTAGADQIRYDYRYPGYGLCGTLSTESDLMSFYFHQNNIGAFTYSYTLKKDGKWTKWSDPISVNVKPLTTPTDLPYATPTDLDYATPTDLSPVTPTDLQ